MAKGKKRSSPRGRGSRLNIWQSLFFIVVLVAAGYVLLQSPLFSVKDVLVEGAQALKVDEIQRLSGINPGINTFKLNLKEVQERVAMNPLVKQVKVKRDYPGAILIQVEERKAVALLPAQGEYLAVDAEGYYLTRVKDFSKANLPIITGIRLGNLTPGKQIAGDGLAAALKFVQKMDQNQLANLSEVNGADPLGIVIYTLGGTEVRLGASERIEEKLALMREALKNSYGRKVEYIDITYAGKPVIKFLDTPESKAKAGQTANNNKANDNIH
ncbi:MAG: FtsQ-type POTRA domain-containing protein [Clostridia bacterium]|nr:FtsQ-type POTRA domain-containing protein [Clostridia bacterium]